MEEEENNITEQSEQEEPETKHEDSDNSKASDKSGGVAVRGACFRNGAVSPCGLRLGRNAIMGISLMLLSFMVAIFCMVVLVAYNFESGYEQELLTPLTSILFLYAKPPTVFARS